MGKEGIVLLSVAPGNPFYVEMEGASFCWRWDVELLIDRQVPLSKLERNKG